METKALKTGVLRIGVSACLLGQQVRYDGGHKLSEVLVTQLGRSFEFVPICPEVGIGMGVPRPPIRLEREAGRVHAKGVEHAELDVTESLLAYGTEQGHQLADICGYVFKSRSPSCGAGSTPIYDKLSGRVTKGDGLFARQIKQSFPLLPVVEETDLLKPAKRLNFLQRVQAYLNWQAFMREKRGTWEGLSEFHQQNRFALMSHGQRGFRNLEHWLHEKAKQRRSKQVLISSYGQHYMAHFTRPITHRRQVYVLRHIAGLWRTKGFGREIPYIRLKTAVEGFAAGKTPLTQVACHILEMQAVYPLSELVNQSYLRSIINGEGERIC